MQHTSIEWVRNPDGSPGWTFNPITGCLNNCSYCYARKLANTRLKDRYLANGNIALVKGIPATTAIDGFMSNPFYPRFWEDKLDELNPFKHMIRHQVPRGIFVCDMSDLFGIGIPEEWTRRVLKLCKGATQHRFYLLTKQPQNLIKFSPFPDNCWVGVSATDGGMYQKAMLWLAQVEAKVKYISFEPLLGRIEFYDKPIVGLNWVIIGAQTKPYRPPAIEDVKEIVEACDAAGIPVFIKEPMASHYNLQRQEHP